MTSYSIHPASGSVFGVNHVAVDGQDAGPTDAPLAGPDAYQDHSAGENTSPGQVSNGVSEAFRPNPLSAFAGRANSMVDMHRQSMQATAGTTGDPLQDAMEDHLVGNNLAARSAHPGYPNNPGNPNI